MCLAAMVQVLAKLPPSERASIGSEAILVPDRHGPRLIPARHLVYDNAPWLSSRLQPGTVRFVHPDIAEQVTFAGRGATVSLVTCQFLMAS